MESLPALLSEEINDLYLITSERDEDIYTLGKIYWSRQCRTQGGS